MSYGVIPRGLYGQQQMGQPIGAMPQMGVIPRGLRGQGQMGFSFATLPVLKSVLPLKVSTWMDANKPVTFALLGIGTFLAAYKLSGGFNKLVNKYIPMPF